MMVLVVCEMSVRLLRAGSTAQSTSGSSVCTYINYFDQIDRDGLGPTDSILRASYSIVTHLISPHLIYDIISTRGGSTRRGGGTATHSEVCPPHCLSSPNEIFGECNWTIGPSLVYNFCSSFLVCNVSLYY